MSKEVDDFFLDESEVPKSTGGSTIDFFDLANNGDSANVTFLDPDPDEDSGVGNPPILHLHNVFGFRPNETFPTKVSCSAVKKDTEGNPQKCVICEYCKTLEEGSRTRGMLEAKSYYCQSVEVSGVFDKKGNEYAPSKQVRLVKTAANFKILEKIEELGSISEGPMEKINGLFGNKFKVTRSNDDKAARIGEIGTYIGSPEEVPHEFTKQELISKIVTDQEAIDDYANRMLNSVTYSPKIAD